MESSSEAQGQAQTAQFEEGAEVAALTDGGRNTGVGDGSHTEVDLETQSKAIRQGWVPRERYTGEPSKWVDAATFVQRGENFTGNLKAELAEMRRQFTEFEGTKKAFVKFHEETLARKDAEYKDAIAALRVQRSQAQAEGDHEVAIQLEDRIDSLRESQKTLKAEAPSAKQAPTQPDMENPVLQEWVKDEAPWFATDAKLRDYAVSVGEQLLASGETARGRPFLDKVLATVHRDFPRRFKLTGDASVIAGAAAVGGQGGGQSGGKHTAAQLPEEDRKLMKQFVAAGWTTEEKFLKSYFNQ